MQRSVYSNVRIRHHEMFSNPNSDCHCQISINNLEAAALKLNQKEARRQLKFKLVQVKRRKTRTSRLLPSFCPEKADREISSALKGKAQHSGWGSTITKGLELLHLEWTSSLSFLIIDLHRTNKITSGSWGKFSFIALSPLPFIFSSSTDASAMCYDSSEEWAKIGQDPQSDLKYLQKHPHHSALQLKGENGVCWRKA